MEELKLQQMTRELCHELYKEWENDEAISVVTCQNERSQFQNKDKAMQMLKAKLYMLKKEEEEAKLAGIRGEVKDIAWGSQIRSYVLQPYTLVKDTRTQEETSNTGAVLDGDIDRFINAYLRMGANKAGRSEEM